MVNESQFLRSGGSGGVSKRQEMEDELNGNRQNANQADFTDPDFRRIRQMREQERTRSQESAADREANIADDPDIRHIQQEREEQRQRRERADRGDVRDTADSERDTTSGDGGMAQPDTNGSDGTGATPVDQQPTPDPTPTAGEVAQEQDVGGSIHQRSRLIHQVLRSAPPGARPSDVVLVREGGRLVGRLREQAQRRLATEDLEETFETRTGVDLEPGRDFVVFETDEGFGARLTQAGFGTLGIDRASVAADIEDFSLGLRRMDPADIEDIERGMRVELPTPSRAEIAADIEDFAAGQRARNTAIQQAESQAQRDIEGQLEQQVGIDLDPTTDIRFSEIQTDEGTQIVGRLTEQGRRRVGVETSLVVSAAEATGLFGPQARALAGSAFDLREFGRTQREEVVQPVLDELRVSSGLSDEIEAFEGFTDRAAAAEEQVLAPARQATRGRLPEALAAGAFAVGTRGAAATGPGALILGTVAASGIAAETIENLPPRQQLAIGAAASTAMDPVGTARAAVTGDVGRPVARTQVSRFFPSEQQVPERRELFRSELAIQEQNVFLPELQTPSAPQSQFTAGRFTPPEVSVDTADPAQAFGGSEVSVDTEEPGVAFGGSELPTPTVQAQPQQVVRREPEFMRAPPRQRQRQRRRRVPEEFIPDEPMVIGGGVGSGIGEAGEGATRPGGGFRVVFRRGPTRSIEPQIIQTPFADIDIAGIDPALARVTREQPLSGEDVFTRELSVAEPGVSLRPTGVRGAFGLTDERVAQETAQSPLGSVSPMEDTSITQAQRQAQATDVMQRTVTETTTTIPTATTPQFGTPTVPAENIIRESFGHPTVTQPANARPRGRFDLDLGPDSSGGGPAFSPFDRRFEVDLPAVLGEPSTGDSQRKSALDDLGGTSSDDLFAGLGGLM